MKRIIYVLTAFLMFSCSEQKMPDGYGFLQVPSLCIETQTDIQPLKRSADSRLQVDICQGASVVRTYAAGSPELNAPISLPAGNYTLYAHTPDTDEAADNEQGAPIYSVSTDFGISEGATTVIEPQVARQINIGVLLQYPEELFRTAFQSVTCTLISPSGRSVTIEGIDNLATAYFNMPENGQLQYTLKVINTDNESYTNAPKTLKVEAGKDYCINVAWE